MNAAQRNRQFALLRATGFEDGPALTLASTDGGIPHGRELSFAWLTGTVMTGLTSVLLMGAALYVSFEGQSTFSTAYEALQILTRGGAAAGDASDHDVVVKLGCVEAEPWARRIVAPAKCEKIVEDRPQQVDGHDHVEMLVLLRLLQLQRSDSQEFSRCSDHRGAAPMWMRGCGEKRFVQQIFPIAGEFLLAHNPARDRTLPAAVCRDHHRIADFRFA